MDPNKLRLLATFLDKIDTALRINGKEVQRDLRKWADELEKPQDLFVCTCPMCEHHTTAHAITAESVERPPTCSTCGAPFVWCKCDKPIVKVVDHDAGVEFHGNGKIVALDRRCHCTCLEIDATGTCMRCGAKAR